MDADINRMIDQYLELESNEKVQEAILYLMNNKEAALRWITLRMSDLLNAWLYQQDADALAEAEYMNVLSKALYN